MGQFWHGLIVGVLGSSYVAVMTAIFFNKSLKGISLPAGLLVGSPLLFSWWIMLMRDEVVAVFISVVVMYLMFMWLKKK